MKGTKEVEKEIVEKGEVTIRTGRGIEDQAEKGQGLGRGGVVGQEIENGVSQRNGEVGREIDQESVHEENVLKINQAERGPEVLRRADPVDLTVGVEKRKE